MSKVLLRTPDRATPAPLPPLEGLSASGAVQSHDIIATEKYPLSLWRYDLCEGGSVSVTGAPVGHLFYVVQGEVSANGEPAGRMDAIVAEAGAELTISCSSGEAQVLHFYSPVPSAKDAKSTRAVHVMRKKELDQHVHPQTAITLYADCTSEACDLWLHAGETPAGMTDYKEQMHYHTQDEIIYVVEGSMLVGPRRVPTGTALAVAGKTVYSFEIHEDALHFINFRAGPSSVAVVEGEGFTDEMPEIQFITSLPLRKAA